MSTSIESVQCQFFNMITDRLHKLELDNDRLRADIDDLKKLKPQPLGKIHPTSSICFDVENWQKPGYIFDLIVYTDKINDIRTFCELFVSTAEASNKFLSEIKVMMCMTDSTDYATPTRSAAYIQGVVQFINTAYDVIDTLEKAWGVHIQSDSSNRSAYAYVYDTHFADTWVDVFAHASNAAECHHNKSEELIEVYQSDFIRPLPDVEIRNVILHIPAFQECSLVVMDQQSEHRLKYLISLSSDRPLTI